MLQLPRNCLLTDSTPACLQVLHGSMGAARQQAQHDPQHWPTRTCSSQQRVRHSHSNCSHRGATLTACCSSLQMVGSHGSYHVARAARPAGEQHSLHMRFSRKASTTSSGHFLQSRTSIFARVLRSASGYHHKHAAGPLPHNGMAPGSSNQVPDDAVLDVGVLAGEQKPAAGVNGDLQQAKSNDRTQLANAGSVLTTQASMQSPFEVSALVKAPSHSDTALPVITPKEAASADDSNEEYVINPRLTLVFRDVWVADIPIEEGLARKAKRRLVGLCRKDSSTRDDHSSAHGAQAGRSSTSGSSSSSAQRETVAKLEAAAAEGAFFIVPGNSSRFTHSQLHAIMGPSG